MLRICVTHSESGSTLMASFKKNPPAIGKIGHMDVARRARAARISA
jgi:hypothetical protein